MSSTVLVRERASCWAATRTTTLAVTELPGWLPTTYQRIATYLGTVGHRPSGPPFARYRRLDDGRFRVTAGFPVDGTFIGDGDVVAEWIPGGRVAVVHHRGSYDTMAPAYRTLAQWLIDHHAVASDDPSEVYRTGPEAASNPGDQLTDVVQPFRLDPRPAAESHR